MDDLKASEHGGANLLGEKEYCTVECLPVRFLPLCGSS